MLLLVDMLACAIDTPAPATIILISGDRDFAYAVSTLRLRRYRVVVISAGEVHVHSSLKAHASVFLDWHTGVLLPNSKVEDEGRCLYTRNDLEDARLTTSVDSPSRRYSNISSLLSSTRTRFGSEDVEVNIMDHLHAYGTHKSSHYHTTLEPSLAEVNLNVDTSTSNGGHRSFLPNCHIDDTRSPTPRAPSRTGSAPAVYSGSEISLTSRSAALSSNSDYFSARGNISAPATLSSRPRTPLKVLDISPASPQRKKAAQDTINGASGNISPLPTPPIPDPFLGQRPEYRVPPATMPGYPTNASASPSPPSTPVKHPTVGHPALSIVTSTNECLADTGSVKSGKSIPPGFEPLVRTLDMYRSQGVLRPSRSKVALELATQANGVYRRVGAERFGQYANMAVKVGVVELGGKEGGAWIALRSEYTVHKST